MLAVVDYGQGPPQTVVTGAPNLRPGDRGQKVAFAVEGAQLIDAYSDDTTSANAPEAHTIRGVESAGMICSEKELGLSDDQWASSFWPRMPPSGSRCRTSWAIRCWKSNSTPNLAHANCIVGLAREVAA